MFILRNLFFAALLFIASRHLFAQSRALVTDVLVLPVNSDVPQGAIKVTTLTRAVSPVFGYERAIGKMAYNARHRGGNALLVRDVKYPVGGRDVIIVTADVYKVNDVDALIKERVRSVEAMVNAMVESSAQYGYYFVVRPGVSPGDPQFLTLHIGDTAVCKIASGQSCGTRVPADEPIQMYLENGWGIRRMFVPRKGEVALFSCCVTPCFPFGKVCRGRLVQSYYGAEELLRQPVEKELPELMEPVYTSRLHFATFWPVGAYNPGWEVGYERMIGRRYSARVFGSLLDDHMTKSYFSYSGGRIGLECKRFQDFGGGTHAYISTELVASDIAFTNAFEFADTGVQRVRAPYSDTIGVASRSLALNFKTGIQQTFGRFILDIYTGVGVKYKKLEHSGRLYPKDQLYSSGNNFALREMNGVTVSVPLNLSLAYCFGRKTKQSK